MTLKKKSLIARTLRVATLRIGTVSLCVGLISYFLNASSLEETVKRQLLLSTQQTLQMEARPFQEIRNLQRNFLRDYSAMYDDPSMKAKLLADFDQWFVRHEDGSFTQRPGIFEGEPLPNDGRRFGGMSATYAPDHPPDGDVRVRFALSFLLSHKYGSSAQGSLFNFYGVVPEKGFPIYQDADIAKVFTYSGESALNLDTYEFYSRGFAAPTDETFLTSIYYDHSNQSWMTTMVTPGPAGSDGKRRILACVDILLDELMSRMARPAMQGARSSIFLPDDGGTLIYHPDHLERIKESAGSASILSLGIASDQPLLEAARKLALGQVEMTETLDEIVALGRLPETPWVLAIRYPKQLMRPAIMQNLGVVVALGLLTLLVEVFILRSVLQDHVARPLGRLMRAARMLGQPETRLAESDLPLSEDSEVGALAQDFHAMALRVEEAQTRLEEKVHERTLALEDANRRLVLLSATDGLTGVANRRHFDEILEAEWRRARRLGSPLLLCMIDVDLFKKYNDTYGHLAGDECLRTVTRCVGGLLQRPDDLIARYGGEEFVLLCPSVRAEHALDFADKIHSALEVASVEHAASPFGRVTVSIGIALIVPAAENAPTDLLSMADQALYEAKNSGRNQTRFHSADGGGASV